MPVRSSGSVSLSMRVLAPTEEPFYFLWSPDGIKGEQIQYSDFDAASVAAREYTDLHQTDCHVGKAVQHVKHVPAHVITDLVESPRFANLADDRFQQPTELEIVPLSAQWVSNPQQLWSLSGFSFPRQGAVAQGGS